MKSEPWGVPRAQGRFLGFCDVLGPLLAQRCREGNIGIPTERWPSTLRQKHLLLTKYPCTYPHVQPPYCYQEDLSSYLLETKHSKARSYCPQQKHTPLGHLVKPGTVEQGRDQQRRSNRRAGWSGSLRSQRGEWRRALALAGVA